MNEAAQSRPNFVIILADDMGFSDIGCFGAEIRTPHLDSLAAGGVRFTQMYNCARCCPTRASLLTGLYPHQAGVGHMVGDRGVGPAYQGYLRPDAATIGEVLGAAGYRTCYAGKWHTSPGIPMVGEPVAEPGSDRNPAPFSRGFQDFYGTLAGGGNYFSPHGLMQQDRRIQPPPEDFYYTDAISGQACRMIADSAATGRPFLLHVCYTAPHWPLHALPDDIERYRGRYRQGWDKLRTARHEELRGLGLVDRGWEISPRYEQAALFAGLDAARMDWEDMRMAVYAAQIDRMDQGIGTILQTLRRHGLEDNTVVLFLSDNGGCAEFLNEDGDSSRWPGSYALVAPPGVKCRVGNIPGIAPGTPDTFMSYDLPWAHASNSPFRLFKHWVHEGGISTPCVLRWPRGAQAGHISHRPCHVVDIMATCMDLAGCQWPASVNGMAAQLPEGESLGPLLAGRETPRQQALFWEHEGNCAVRDGDWKLVRKFPGDWELYNMEKDRTEVHNLAGSEPGRVQTLAAAYRDWAARCGVRDWPIKP